MKKSKFWWVVLYAVVVLLILLGAVTIFSLMRESTEVAAIDVSNKNRELARSYTNHVFMVKETFIQNTYFYIQFEDIQTGNRDTFEVSNISSDVYHLMKDWKLSREDKFRFILYPEGTPFVMIQQENFKFLNYLYLERVN